MSNYPDWPAVNVNFRASGAGVECIMQTRYDKVNLSVSIVAKTSPAAERAADRSLRKKINQRDSFK